MDTQRFDRPARLRGAVSVPGDKSISHRALLLAALADGPTRISGIADGGDVRATRQALQQLGVATAAHDGQWLVHGSSSTGLRSPDAAIDCGNSGTTLRLLMGVLAGQDGITARLHGDPSLSRRPMRRVAVPLGTLGADIRLSEAGTAPAVVHGRMLCGGRCDLPIASAQVKSALLLAGLSASAPVAVREPLQSRDHTERMLGAMGRHVDVADGWLTVSPGPLHALGSLSVPGDPSSAAFAAVAAVLHPQGWVRVDGIGLNPTRTGWVAALQQMGAAVETTAMGEMGGEPWGQVVARSSRLGALRITPPQVPSLIDELPVLAVAAAAAEGTSRWDGIDELRVKESDRLARIEQLLGALGVVTRSGADWLEIDGAGSASHWRGGCVRSDAGLDHRMAMAAAVAGLVGGRAVEVSGFSAVASSWPGFLAAMQMLSDR